MMIDETRQVSLMQPFDNGSSLSLPSPSASSSAQQVAQNPQELRQAAKQYEAFFVSYLLKVMRETVHETGMTGKDAQYFYSFYDQEIGNRAAEAGGIGITRMVEAYIEKNMTPPSSSSAPGNPIKGATGFDAP